MTTIDELGRRAAAAARADAAQMAAARMESGLERLRLEGASIVAAPRRGLDPRRWITLGTAAALIAAAIVALVVNANESADRRVVPGGSTTQVTTASTAVATTSGGSTEAPSTTEAQIVVRTDAIAVSRTPIPPDYPATSFLGITDQSHLPLVAIGDTRIVTVDGSTATLIDPFSPSSPDTPPTPVPLDVTPAGNIAAGPGDVLYGVVQGTDPLMSLDAIALSGDRAGQVIASAPISAAAFAEAPSGVLGHGTDGIIDRRTGETLLGYVDQTGAASKLTRSAHDVAITSGDLAAGGDLVVHDPDGSHDWHLAITRDPAYPGLPTGEAPVAASSHGGAVVWTAVGPAGDTTADVAAPTEPVIAVLAADGTGTWYSLTDGWQVAASDLDGTILMRLNGSTLELARLDPPQRLDFLDQPASPHQRVQFAATLPTSLTTATPCTIDDLDVEPTADGAMGTTYGVVYVRNKSDQPCQVAGVPDVAYLDGSGNIVQSTDPALLGQSQGTPIVLERDSWATALIGAIASNVCGGNESSQFRLTIDGKSTVIPFAVGGPLQPDQCDPSNVQTPVAGALEAQPFEPVQANTDQYNPLDYVDITLDAPTTVRAGDILHYDVVVTAKSVPSNGSKEATPVVLSDSCPVYTESLGSASGELQLNCNGDAGVDIAPGESVRFHIELLIPADAPTGPATLTWTAVEPTAAPVTASVTITT